MPKDNHGSRFQWKSLSSQCMQRRGSNKGIITPNALEESQQNFVSVMYELPGYWEQDAPYAQEGVSLLDVPEAGHLTEKGAPMLVREGLFVPIPKGVQYSSVEAEILCQQELSEKYDILPAPEDVLETKQLTFRKNRAIYESEEAYPPEIVSYVRTLEIDGNSYVHLFVFPFQYLPKKKRMTAFTKIKLTVHYVLHVNSAETDADTDANMGTNVIASAETDVYIDADVIASAETDVYIGADIIAGAETDADMNANASQNTNTTLSTDTISTPAAPDTKPRLLILTTEQLAYSLRIYEGVKTFLYDAEIVYLETVQKQYSSPDTVEAIHSFLMDEHKKKPISYVLLGGGMDIIPSKMIDIPGVSGQAASDHYYCTTGDESEPLPLFALGRMPVSTIPEMNDMVDYASYYNRFFNEKRKRAVFIAEDSPQCGFKECKQEICEMLGDEFSVAECYDGECSKSDVISEINQGVGFINYRGHGTYDAWESANGLSVKDIPKLKVVRNTPHVLSLDCKSCAIHKPECLGVSWMRQLKAISFLGASEATYTMVNNDFDKYLWECIYDQRLTKIGDIFKEAVTKLYRNNPDLFTVTNIAEYLLLGDPTADYMDDKSDKKEEES